MATESTEENDERGFLMKAAQDNESEKKTPYHSDQNPCKFKTL